MEAARYVEGVVRCLATASKSLRLYPPSSPMPQQSAAAVVAALEEYFTSGEGVLSLAVTRDGFASQGETLSSGLMGISDFASELRDHGVAELSILPGCTAAEVVSFLDLLGKPVDEIRAEGGVSTAAVMAGVDTIRVADVQLTVVERIGPAPDEDIDEFLRELARDPNKLAAWFGAAAAGDPHTFEEGLMELVRVTGPGGAEQLLESLAGAFRLQESGAKDTLLGLAMEMGGTRDLTAGVFKHLGSGDIAGAVLEGQFGKNMLSLSTALTRLPLEQVTAQVRAEIQAMLPGAGHSGKEARFLDHMIEARERTSPEPALADADRSYRAVIEASGLPQDIVSSARKAVSASSKTLSTASVRTMTALLDQQQDFELFCQGAESLASMVPKLIEQGDLDTVSSVLADLSNRAALPISTWPELPERLNATLMTAMGERSMSALLRIVVADRSRMQVARQMMRFAGEPAALALVTEALASKAEGIEVAEELLGRRVIDLLNQVAPRAQWFELRALVSRLTREGDVRSMTVVGQLLDRADEQSRREVVAGLADSGSPAAARLLATALKDPSDEVALVAVRALARLGTGGAGSLLAERLSELDIDNGQFILGREIITALARIPDSSAEAALKKLASRKALIKKGHFAEVQNLASRALEVRAKEGVGR